MGRKPALSSYSPQRIAHALRPSESQKPNMSVPYPARPRLPRSKERVPKKCKEQRREEELDCLGPPPRSRCGHSGSPHEVLRQTTLPVHCRLLAPRPSRGQNAICEEESEENGRQQGTSSRRSPSPPPQPPPLRPPMWNAAGQWGASSVRSDSELRHGANRSPLSSAVVVYEAGSTLCFGGRGAFARSTRVCAAVAK